MRLQALLLLLCGCSWAAHLDAQRVVIERCQVARPQRGGPRPEEPREAASVTAAVLVALAAVAAAARRLEQRQAAAVVEFEELERCSAHGLHPSGAGPPRANARQWAEQGRGRGWAEQRRGHPRQQHVGIGGNRPRKAREVVFTSRRQQVRAAELGRKGVSARYPLSSLTSYNP